jgi:hypothetical protein
MTGANKRIDLENKRVFVRLTNEGVGALHDLVQGGTSFSAWVKEERPYGLWIVRDEASSVTDNEFVLVKWNYLETVTLIERKPETTRKV